MPTRRHIVAKACAVCAGLASSGGAGLAALATGEIRQPGYMLRFVGSVRETIMRGRTGSLLDLRTLRDKPHLCGLGPLEGLTGEATIVDSRPALVRIGADRAAHVTESFDGGAPFFVWAEVPAWQTMKLPPNVRTFAQLETFVGEAGSRAGFRQAFPFILKGQPAMVDFHVLDAKPDTPSGMEAHKRIQIPFELTHSAVLFVGFWSSAHQGVFTPMGSNMHVHFQTVDNLLSGHVQGLDLTSKDLTLSLPKS